MRERSGTLRERADDGTRTHDLLHGKSQRCSHLFAGVRSNRLVAGSSSVRPNASERERTPNLAILATPRSATRRLCRAATSCAPRPLRARARAPSRRGHVSSSGVRVERGCTNDFLIVEFDEMPRDQSAHLAGRRRCGFNRSRRSGRRAPVVEVAGSRRRRLWPGR
jgi:hypothetical protein